MGMISIKCFCSLLLKEFLAYSVSQVGALGNFKALFKLWFGFLLTEE